MKTIHKYAISAENNFPVSMPEGAEIIHCARQQDICIWAIIDAEARKVVRYFSITGTGLPIPDGDVAHIGSGQSGPLVWHLFEHLKPEK